MPDVKGKVSNPQLKAKISATMRVVQPAYPITVNEDVGIGLVVNAAGMLADPMSSTYSDAVAVGIQLQLDPLAPSGGVVEVTPSGGVVYAGWSFTPGADIFLGPNGTLIETVPVAANFAWFTAQYGATPVFNVKIGTAMSATSLHLSIREPIRLR